MGFPTGEQYTGSDEQNKKLDSTYRRKAEPIVKLGTPVWNGELIRKKNQSHADDD